MIYQYKDSFYNLTKVTKVLLLKDYFRWDCYLKPKVSAYTTWYGRKVPEVPAKFYRLSFMDDTIEITREQAVYGDNYIRIWFGKDYETWKLENAEAVSNLIEQIKIANAGCKFEAN